MTTKNVTLVNGDLPEQVIPEDDALEIARLRAYGWATKEDQKAAAKVEAKAEGSK